MVKKGILYLGLALLLLLLYLLLRRLRRASPSP
jgi:hypothetical protein